MLVAWKPRAWMLSLTVTAVAATALGLRAPRSAPPRTYDSRRQSSAIVGVVNDKAGPVAAARVRIQGAANFTLTDGQGRFSLPLPAAAPSLVLAAWKEGYFIGGATWNGASSLRQPIADSRQSALQITLTPLPERDNSNYAWVDPSPDPAGVHNCANCHEEIYREWKSSGHAHAAANRRFLNLYDGTDWHGRRGRGWSLLDEHLHGAGVCAACHAPTLAFDHPASDDLRRIDGVAAHGVHCDYCHKVQDVDVTHVGLTHGRFATRLLRPEHDQLFFGPLDDVTRDEDAYSPLQKESRYCAACHEGVVFGVHVYSTYSEWLESPARRQGRSCQSCHMTPTGRMTNIAPGAGGVERDPKTLASHTFLPGGREAMLRQCLEVNVDYRYAGNDATATVTVTAKNVGHRVPTGFIDRHLVLIVEPTPEWRAGGVSPLIESAHDAVAKLQGADAPRSPDGSRDELLLPPAVSEGLAGKPGRLFARLLADEQGRPIPFWRGLAEPRDTRLVPHQPVVSEFHFPHADPVRVRLLYRRFWADTAREKSWPDDTIVVYDRVWEATE